MSDSVSSFPSLVEQGLSHVPARVAAAQPALKRWNSGTAAPPRSPRTPQHLAHPALDPTRLPEALDLHTSCRGLMGPSHCVTKLAQLAGDEAFAASTVGAIQCDSVALLRSLKRRAFAEALLRRAQSDSAEYEKRYWLNELLRRREEAAAARTGVSAREHAATVGAAAAATEAGGAGGAPAAHWPSGGASVASSLASSRSFVAARRPLPPSSSSVHSLTSRTTFLPPEHLPRLPALTQSQRGALKVSSRTPLWQPVMQNGEHPPQPLPGCPATRTALLPPGASSVAVLNAAALSVLGLGGGGAM